MKTRFKFVPIVAALGFAAGAGATEYGNVVSSTPIVRTVPVAQRVCEDQPVVYQAPTSGVGALIGALTGAAIGHNVGGGDGRAVATGIGLIAGSVIGDRVEGDSMPPVASTVRQCRVVTRYENRTVGYDVVYDYRGLRQHAQLAQDPGDRIALNVAVAPADGWSAGTARPPVVDAQPVYVQPAYPQPVYAQPVYAQPVYAQPVVAEPGYAAHVIVYPGPRFGGGDGGDWRWRDHRGDRWDRDDHDDRDGGAGWRGRDR
ncbi:MAG: glycine zipper 2TM domain-containing protein [Burkholderiales bacterium]|nr:glycine zipper 2TM domain-containing protein [Burkholderiales bacterium]MDE1929154.1 glycine zipper 2TM domain-containing protein [Burkholderiales bacterium]MDE2159562.1 glycine zipper 2TM domain-containing protein [Burkholderiales bacterium]MDE2503292.1 glycine zipper 2TM domain-containing protein [Burkholderiales bacterium]